MTSTKMFNIISGKRKNSKMICMLLLCFSHESYGAQDTVCVVQSVTSGHTFSYVEIQRNFHLTEGNKPILKAGSTFVLRLIF